jgi:hypothetical protein
MTTTTTQTNTHVNGDDSYSYKFIPKVNAIPVVNSLTKQIFTHVPRAEAASKYVGDHLNTAFNYTKDTPIQPMLIRLDTLAANGVAKLEKEVPIVTTPTEEVIKKTQIDKLLSFVSHYYVVTLDFTFNFLGAYKGVFDPTISTFLGRFESFLNVSANPDDTQTVRFDRVRRVFVQKVNLLHSPYLDKASPYINKAKDSYSTVYATAQPFVEYPLKQIEIQKGKAKEFVGLYASEFKSRLGKAETAAKEAWNETRPDLKTPTSIIPALKSTIFVAVSFGYNFVFPEKPAEKPAPSKPEEQTNGLVSGVECRDGEAKKRANGTAY